MPESDRPPAFSIRAHWPRIVLAVLSAGIAWYVWSRPVSPIWSRPIAGDLQVLGISQAGQLTTLSQSTRNGPAKLQVRKVATGEIEREFDLAAARYGLSQVTPDGQWAVIQVSSAYQLMVVSLQTGQLRYPPLHSDGVGSISADSKHAIIFRGNDKLIDLATGEQKAAYHIDAARFSKDSRELLIRHQFSQNLTIVDLADQSQRSLGKLPQHPIRPESPRHLNIEAWRDDRVYVSNRRMRSDSQGWEVEFWSFDTRGDSLSDLRREPELFGRGDSRDSHYSTWRNGHRGELRRGESWKSGGIYEWLLKRLVALKIRVKSARILESWQPLDPQTGVPQGAVIHDLAPSFSISDDGQWLVDGRDQQLRCWQLPAHRGLRRWLETLLAGLLPGGLVRVVYRFKRARQAGTHETAAVMQ